jgi:hypothetical protein
MAKTTTAKKPSIATAKPAAKVTTAKEAPLKTLPVERAGIIEKQKEEAKTKVKATEAKTTTRATGTAFAGKRIFLNMKNEKVASAEGNNPKRGKCREWFTWYMPEAKSAKGLAVEEYIKRGGKPGYIRWDSEHELITLQ